jgi:hypothetical protein
MSEIARFCGFDLPGADRSSGDSSIVPAMAAQPERGRRGEVPYDNRSYRVVKIVESIFTIPNATDRITNPARMTATQATKARLDGPRQRSSDENEIISVSKGSEK